MVEIKKNYKHHFIFPQLFIFILSFLMHRNHQNDMITNSKPKEKRKIILCFVVMIEEKLFCMVAHLKDVVRVNLDIPNKILSCYKYSFWLIQKRT